MLQGICKSFALALIFFVPMSAGAEANPATASWAEVRPTVAASAYPERWRLRSLAQTTRTVYRPAAGAPQQSLRPASTGIVVGPSVAISAGSTRPDSSDSLLERLDIIRRTPIATLWRGRRTNLVLGFLDGGYFGIRLGEVRLDD